MSNVLYLATAEPSSDVTGQLIADLLDLVAHLTPKARADLLAFVHLVNDPATVTIDVDVADDGTVRVTLVGKG